MVTVMGMDADMLPTRVAGKTRLAGEKLSVGGGTMTDATRGTLCGEPLALSVAIRVALTMAPEVGRKAMESVQL